MKTLLALFLWNITAWAAETPRYLVDHSSTFVGRSLGYGCFAFEIRADHIFCNPAQIAKERDRGFSSNFFLGQNLRKISEVNEVLNGTENTDTIRSLFNERESSEIESRLDVGYIGPTWGVALTPFQVQFFTRYRNSALPEITVFAARTQTASLQVGSYVGSDIFIGLQGDLERTEYIQSRFFLTDIMTEDSKHFIGARTESNLFLTPSLLYAPENGDFNPQIGLALANYKVTNQGVDHSFPNLPQYHLSASIETELALGRIGVGADIVWDQRITRFLDAATLASYYTLGVLKILGHYSELSKGLGFLVHHKEFNAGITYSDRVYFEDTRDHVRRVYLVVGVEI